MKISGLAVFLARMDAGKNVIRKTAEERFDYDLSRKIHEIRPECKTNIICQGAVPEAIIAFLDSESFEDAIREACHEFVFLVLTGRQTIKFCLG